MTRWTEDQLREAQARAPKRFASEGGTVQQAIRNCPGVDIDAAHKRKPGVTLPIRTESAANIREHWTKRAKRVAAERKAAFLLFPGATLPCTIKIVRIAPRSLDGDNLQSSAKGLRDGIADKLGIADNDPRVSWEYGQERGAAKYYAVRIEIVRSLEQVAARCQERQACERYSAASIKKGRGTT